LRESLTLNNVAGLTMSAAAFGVLAAVLVAVASLALGVGLVAAPRRRVAEARAEVIDPRLLSLSPDQRRWASDGSVFKVCAKDQEVGTTRSAAVTWATAVEAVNVAERSQDDGGMDVRYLTSSSEEAEEFVRDCAEILGGAEVHASPGPARTFRIDFPSGHAIIARPFGLGHVRGKCGYAILDNADANSELLEWISAVQGLMIWGGRAAIIGTYYDAHEDSPFAKLVESVRSGEQLASLHEVRGHDLKRHDLKRIDHVAVIPPSASSSSWQRPTLHGLLVVLALGLAGCEASEGVSAAALAISMSAIAVATFTWRWRAEADRDPVVNRGLDKNQVKAFRRAIDPAEADKAWVIKGPLAAPPQHQGASEAPAAPEELEDLLRAKIAEQRAELAERTGLPATAFATKEEMTFGWTRDDGEVSFDAALAEMAGKPLEERESARPDAKLRPSSTAFLALPLLATLGACGPTFVIWDSGDGDGDPGTAEPGIPDLPDESTETDETEVPPDMPGDGDGDSTGDGDPTGDGDGDPYELFTECDDEGRCWARRAWWTAWAQLSDPEGIQAGLDDGTLVQVESIDGAKCYQYGEPPGTVCVLGLDGVDLHARPLDEIEIVADPDCAGDGPWSSSFSSTFWCYGRFSSLGVALKDI
jgi:hypothetical protein